MNPHTAGRLIGAPLMFVGVRHATASPMTLMKL
jgi:hypothetical protein